jgi:hypothetical protein
MSWTVTDHTNVHGAPLGTFAPAAYVFQGQHHVVYQGFSSTGGSDGRIHEFYWAGHWELNELTNAAGAPAIGGFSPAAYTFGNTQHVLYQGAPSDGMIHELWWDDGWNHNELTHATTPVAPPVLNDAIGYAFEPDNTQNVAYQSTNPDHIHELKWDNGWTHQDLTGSFGGTPSTSSPDAYEFTPIGTRQVVYTGNEGNKGSFIGGHVHEFLWDNNGWRDTDLHLHVPAPPPPLASGQPTAYAFRTQETKHVNFTGDDGSIHELWWNFDGWRHNNLSAVTGAPSPGSGVIVTGYAAEAQSTQHVVYGGLDGSIHELMWVNGVWTHNNLSDPPTLAPPSISSRIATYVFVDNSQHLFYIGSNHHLIELWMDA